MYLDQLTQKLNALYSQSEDWAWQQACYNIGWACATCRVSGLVEKAIAECSDLAGLVADVSVSCALPCDVPQFLNARFAA
jgi:hypothetical protein